MESSQYNDDFDYFCFSGIYFIWSMQMNRGKNSTVKSAFGKEHVDCVMQYGGKCRDCADRNGICEATGISCVEKEKAVKYVLDAISYGINNGYIPSNCQSVQT